MDRKGPAGDRLGRVLTDVVTRGGRERPHLWAMALAMVLCLAVAAARALWPLVAGRLPHAG